MADLIDGDGAINVVDLFAGCGGFTQGFRTFCPRHLDMSPFRTVGAVEWDEVAASTYAENFSEEAGGTDHIFAGDIADFDPSILRAEVDVILGGPPCQGFSGLGKEDANDPRNGLWREYARVVNWFKPRVFIIENVDRFLRSPEYSSLRESTEVANGVLRDYRLSEPKILNAADYGVPQARRRAIVLATRRDMIAAHPEKRALTHPRPTHQKPDTYSSTLGYEPDLASWVPVSTIFRQTSTDTSTTELPNRNTKPLGTEVAGPFRTTELHIGRNPTAISLARYRAIPPGGNRHDLPKNLSTENWIRHRNGSGDVMGRMHADRPSVTIRTEFYKPEKGRYLHPRANRPITHYEAALIQGFPNDFKWCGSKLTIGRQIGNAVPVGLARALAEEVYTYLVKTGFNLRPRLETSDVPNPQCLRANPTSPDATRETLAL